MFFLYFFGFRTCFVISSFFSGCIFKTKQSKESEKKKIHFNVISYFAFFHIPSHISNLHFLKVVLRVITTKRMLLRCKVYRTELFTIVSVLKMQIFVTLKSFYNVKIVLKWILTTERSFAGFFCFFCKQTFKSLP